MKLTDNREFLATKGTAHNAAIYLAQAATMTDCMKPLSIAY